MTLFGGSLPGSLARSAPAEVKLCCRKLCQIRYWERNKRNSISSPHNTCKISSRESVTFKGLLRLFPLFSIWWSELTSRDQPHRDEHRLIGSEGPPVSTSAFFSHLILTSFQSCCSTFKRTHPAEVIYCWCFFQSMATADSSGRDAPF
jgi:hypothetical protein